MSMQSQLLRYFAAEKAESVIFVLMGVVALGASVWLWRTGSSYRGMMYAVGIGLVLQSSLMLVADPFVGGTP